MIDILEILEIENKELEGFKIHESWEKFLRDELVREQLIDIIEKLKNEHKNPDTMDKAIRFFGKDIADIKVVIQGQDAYPEEGRATGRSFEVNGLTSWSANFRQVSLKNMVRLLHKTYNDIEKYDDIKKFSEIKKEIELGEFSILPPDQLFESWDKQGVLMVNTYPTCRVGEPGSHKDIWGDFAYKLYDYLADENSDITWFLWGSPAQKTKDVVDGRGVVIASRHPMMCSNRYENDFLKCTCFKDTMGEINWLG